MVKRFLTVMLSGYNSKTITEIALNEKLSFSEEDTTRTSPFSPITPIRRTTQTTMSSRNPATTNGRCFFSTLTSFASTSSACEYEYDRFRRLLYSTSTPEPKPNQPTREPNSLEDSVMNAINGKIYFYSNLDRLVGTLPPLIVMQLKKFYARSRRVQQDKMELSCVIRPPPFISEVFDDDNNSFYDLIVTKSILSEKVVDEKGVVVRLDRRVCSYCMRELVIHHGALESDAVIDQRTERVYRYTGREIWSYPYVLLCDRCRLPCYKFDPQFENKRGRALVDDVKSRYGLD